MKGDAVWALAMAMARRVRVALLVSLMACAWGGCAADGSSTGGGGPETACPGVCEPGAYRCSEEYLLICSAKCDWTLADTCSSAAECDGNAGVCRVCDPMQNRCTGDLLERCAADGSRWEALETCTGRCTDTGCDPCEVPDEVRCAKVDPNAAESTVLQRCASGIGWQVLDTCVSEAVCLETLDDAMSQPETFAGTCLSPICTPDERRCDPDNLLYVQACSETGYSWRVLVVCSDGQTCELDTAGSPHCVAQ